MSIASDRPLSLCPPPDPAPVDGLVQFVERVASLLASRKDSGDAVQCLLDLCLEAVPGTKASLMLRDPVSGDLVIEAAAGIPAPRLRSLRFPPGRGIAGYVVETAAPLCLPDAAAHPNYTPGPAGPAPLRLLAIPVTSPDAVIGVLNLERDPAAPPFGPSDLALLRVAAALLGPAVRELRLRDDLEQRVVDLTTVQVIGNLLVSTLDGEELLENLVTYVADVLSARGCVLYTMDEEAGCFRVRASFGDAPQAAESLLPGQGTIGRVAERRLPLLLRQTAGHPDFDPPFECYPRAASLVLAPLVVKGELLGVILAADRRTGLPFLEADLELLTIFAGQAAAALDNIRLYARLEKAATTDALTHLANRRNFEEVLEKEMARASRYGHPLSLLMLDIDRFKDVNDTYGHVTGDQVLRRLGEVLRNQLRTTDVPARYGGEEFTVIMPHTPKPHAAAVAERLRTKVEEANLFFTTRLRVLTVSIGVAAFPSDGSTMDTFVGAADNALYRAKRAGRNRVIAA